MKVYRFEDANGSGPYGHINFRTHNSRRRPGIRVDVEGNYDWFNWPRELYCGCEDVPSLKKWFQGYLRNLKASGFRIVEYEVPEKHVRFGKSGMQVAFNRNYALKVGVVK